MSGRESVDDLCAKGVRVTTVLTSPATKPDRAEPLTGRTTTRKMCAGTYVWEGFADYVLATFDARPGAGAPSIT